MKVDRYKLASALRIAARQYDSDAHTCDCTPNHERLAEQFRSQHREALAQAEALEQGERFEVTED